MGVAIEHSAMHKIYLRLLPFAVLSYFFAYIDQIQCQLGAVHKAARRGELRS